MKYRVIIEFESDEKITFPADAILVEDMQAQLESLDDGTYEERAGVPPIKPVKVLNAKLIKEEDERCARPVCGCSRKHTD